MQFDICIVFSEISNVARFGREIFQSMGNIALEEELKILTLLQFFILQYYIHSIILGFF